MMMRVKKYKINTAEIEIELPSISITIRRKYTGESGMTEEMLSSKYDNIIKAVLESYSNDKPFDFSILGE